jgi:hypothetical protein
MTKMTNKEIERKAIEKVIEYEGNHGRKKAEEVHGKGYDIISSGRCIEVKGVGGKAGGWRMFEHTCFEALQKEKKYFVYIVENLKTDAPELYIIPRSDIIRHLKLRIVWQINLPAKEMRNKWKKNFK